MSRLTLSGGNIGRTATDCAQQSANKNASRPESNFQPLQTVSAAALGLAGNALSPAYLAEITGMSVNVTDARRALEESLLLAAGITPQHP
jgi:hypothetical protein